MPFPDAERVIYRQNPLTQVICQVRFPTLLIIESESPVAFQERIRHEYPFYKPVAATSIPLPEELLQAFPQLAGLFGGSTGGYEFRDATRSWTVSLTNEALALSTTSYERWETFREKFQGPMAALVDIYHPHQFTRIGLRYRNTIQRSRIGLDNLEWGALLQPYIAGPLVNSDVASRVRGIAQTALLDLSEHPGQVQFQHGVAEENDEQVYVIDSDFFIDTPVEIKDALALLDGFKRKARRLFRWCITDYLHAAMEPVPVTPFNERDTD